MSLATETWTRHVGALPVKLVLLEVFSLPDKRYLVLSGFTAQWASSLDVMIYDPEANAWAIHETITDQFCHIATALKVVYRQKIHP